MRFWNAGVITSISSVSVVESDQDRALAFYTQKLGFGFLRLRVEPEKRGDALH